MSLMLDSLYSAAVRADNYVESRKRMRNHNANSVLKRMESIERCARHLDFWDRDKDSNMWESSNRLYALAQKDLADARERLAKSESNLNDALDESRAAWERYADARARIEALHAGK